MFFEIWQRELGVVRVKDRTSKFRSNQLPCNNVLGLFHMSARQHGRVKSQLGALSFPV